MSTTPTTPQQPSQASLKWYKLQGPDGKWYKTQAASPEDAKAKVAKSAPQAAPAGQRGDPSKMPKIGYAGEASSGVRRGLEGMYDYATTEGQLRPGEKSGTTGKEILTPTRSNIGPAGRFLLHTGEDLVSGVRSNIAATERSKQSGEGIAGQILTFLETFPVVGSAFSRMEKAGPGRFKFEPETLGGLAELATLGAAPKVAEKGLGLAADVVKSELNPTILNNKAAELVTKVTKSAKAEAKDYNKSAALQVAQDGIIDGYRQLPGRIEAARLAKDAAAKQVVKQADAAGMKINVERDVDPILLEAAQVLNTRGLLTSSTKAQIKGLVDRVRTQTDMTPGSPTFGQVIPRNLQSMKPSEVLALVKGLEDLSAFGKEAPKGIENLARRLRGAMNERVGQQLPQVQKLRTEESKLITQRDAARKKFEDVLNDKVSMGKGIIYSGTGTIAVYLGLRALGAFPMAAIGSVVILRALATSARSRLLRAALYAKIGSVMESIKSAYTGATLPASAQTGGNIAAGPRGPQVPPQQQLTGGLPPAGPRGGSPAGAPAAPPFAPASVVNTNAGASLGAAPARLGAAPAPSPAPEPAGRSVALSTTTPSAATPAVADPKAKAMLDRLDTLYDRQAKPKSGADRNAIEREIKQIKSVLSGEASPAERSKINKRIADRERLATKRATASATAPASTAGAGGEAVSQAASPELRAVALDAGYKKLTSYDGGPEMVKALKRTAKDMQRTDAVYDEAQALLDALQFLKEIEDQH